MTTNDNWGYRKSDTNWKTPYEVISIFVDAVSNGGNLLLDIGPKADGTIPDEQVNILKELGAWNKRNGTAIFNTIGGIPQGHFYGPTTLSKDSTTLYLFLHGKTSGPVMVKGLDNKIKSIEVLGNGATLKSKVVGKVGVTLPPLGNPQVLEDSKSGAGYLGYYDGGAFGVPASSKNINCSVLFQQYQGQESVQAKWAAAGSRIVMDSTYSDPIVQEQDTKTNGYYTFMKDQGSLFRGAPPFPFHTSVREVVAPFIYDAIAGKISTSDALDKAAKAADAEMKKLGY